MAWNEPGDNGDKDPWGHRKNEQGPPDLDELLKKMQEKFGGLLGGGSSGGGSSEQNFNPKLILLLAAGLLGIWALFGFYTVQPAEKGIELRFGKYVDTTDQGLNWNYPYPVGEVLKVNVEQVRALEHKAHMLTKDENIVEIELVVQYRINNAKDYLFNVQDPRSTLKQATASALRENVGTSLMDDVLTSGREALATQTKEGIEKILTLYHPGLLIRAVNLQNAQPPAEVQAAFADVIKAREDEERHKNKAQAYKNEIEQKAAGIADRFIQEAEAYRSQVVNLAKGETKRFLSVLTAYKTAPEVTRERLYLETIENVLANTSKVMVDVSKGNQLMLFPLDKLLSGQGGGAPISGNPTYQVNSGELPDNVPATDPPQAPARTVNRDIRRIQR